MPTRKTNQRRIHDQRPTWRIRLGAALLGTTLSSVAGVGWAQVPQQPTAGGAAGVNTPSVASSDVTVRVYNVPSDLVGAVGAQLQMKYHDNNHVSVTTEPKTGQLMIMAPQAIHQQIGAHVNSVLQAANTGKEAGLDLTSTRQRTYNLKHLSWREL